MKMGMLAVHREWHERLIALGCDPWEFCYNAQNQEVMRFLHGELVHVLVDAVPAQGLLKAQMFTSSPSLGDVLERLGRL